MHMSASRVHADIRGQLFSLFSFSTFMGSVDQTQVLMLVQQVPLPAEPSGWPSFIDLKGLLLLF